MKIQYGTFALLLLAALSCSSANALSLLASEGVGRAVDSLGRPVAGVEISIVHRASGTVTRAVTNRSGRWRQSGVRVGEGFDFVAVATGYHPVRLLNVGQRLHRATRFEPVMIPLESKCADIEWTRAAWRYTLPAGLPSCFQSGLQGGRASL